MEKLSSVRADAEFNLPSAILKVHCIANCMHMLGKFGCGCVAIVTNHDKRGYLLFICAASNG